MLSVAELIDKIRAYHPNINEPLIQKAYILSKTAHGNQKRHSGDPYFLHPLAVAEILIDLKLDQESIITALLHDVVEDTEITIDEIKKDFGDNIANLVDGVTKLSKIESISVKERFAENFRKLTLAISGDIRVLLVKLADRLHNMRTLAFMPSQEKRVRKAKETIEIYAPLAARIGLNKIKDQLQDLAFAIIDPENRNYIIEKLAEIRESKKNIIENIIEELTKLLEKEKISFEISGREKKPYSIYQKMVKQNIGFSNLYDIMAFRIVVENVEECYRVMGIINTRYNMIPTTFKDYISTPKENGYKSLHLAILGPFNKKIEIQIRDKKMHQTADLGVAAHWSYKENNKSVAKESEQFKWIRELISLFETSENGVEIAKEIFSNNKLQLHKDSVFCFTPDGDIFNLPFGSTAIDFAYAIHSEIGNSCSSVKINNIIAPLKQKLENGDQVEIITSKNIKPSLNWLQFVVTSKAKHEIRNYIKSQKINEYIPLGREILVKFFAAKNYQFDEKLIEQNLAKFNRKSLQDFYIKVSEGVISRSEVFKIIHPEHQEDNLNIVKEKKSLDKNDQAIAISGLFKGLAIKFAKCCSPIPGDSIVGVINNAVGISVHAQNCNSWKNLNINANSIIDLSWREEEEFFDHNYIAKILVIIENKTGSLADVTSLLSAKKINISNLVVNNKSFDSFVLEIDIEVKNLEHLEHILSSLKISKKIIEAKRIN